MKIWAIALKIIGLIWLYLGSFLILGAITAVLMKQGDAGVRNLLSPFNLMSWFVVIIILLPAVGLLLLANKLGSKT